MPIKIAVVILNWNGRSFLGKFLPDVLRFSSSVAEVIVADNASTDDSVSFLQKNFPAVRLIQNASNSGYTGGYNEALRKVEADYYVLLNSDVEVTANWIEPIIHLMESNKKIGACQPKILSYAHRDEFEYAGAGGGYIDRYGYPFCRGRIFGTIEKDHGQFDDSREIFWATGACMFVRAEAFHKLNGLDTAFFAHMEEIDLCWRMQLEGYQVYYCGSSSIFHVGGGTLPKNNPRKTYLNFRNNLLMIYKNGGSRKSSILFWRAIFDLIAAFKFLFSNGYSDFLAVFEAHRDFSKMKKHYPADSRSAMEYPENSMIYDRPLLWDYYLCGRKTFSSLGWKN